MAAAELVRYEAILAIDETVKKRLEPAMSGGNMGKADGRVIAGGRSITIPLGFGLDWFSSCYLTHGVLRVTGVRLIESWLQANPDRRLRNNWEYPRISRRSGSEWISPNPIYCFVKAEIEGDRSLRSRGFQRVYAYCDAAARK